ncbi:MAG: DUF4352 domain-containing protein [Candidatus Eremiobacterota bacterium]
MFYRKIFILIFIILNFMPIAGITADEKKSEITPVPTAKIKMFLPVPFCEDGIPLTVTNLEYSSVIKNYYTPKEGYRFCTLNVSQINSSPYLQDCYKGNFILFDRKGIPYECVKELSNFWLETLQPGGTNFGHLVYEIPEEAVADRLVLYEDEKPVLTIKL